MRKRWVFLPGQAALVSVTLIAEGSKPACQVVGDAPFLTVGDCNLSDGVLANKARILLTVYETGAFFYGIAVGIHELESLTANESGQRQ